MIASIRNVDSALTLMQFLAAQGVSKDRLPPTGEPAPLSSLQRDSLRINGEEISAAYQIFRHQDCYLYLVEFNRNLSSTLVNSVAQRMYSTGALGIVLCFADPGYQSIAWVARAHNDRIEKLIMEREHPLASEYEALDELIISLRSPKSGFEIYDLFWQQYPRRV
jgi:hypothetical protein